jgi:exodeoxyribonuclease V gamma subunit
MLLIHRSERADALVAALADLLDTPSDDPFRPEIVAVPSKGVERWLAQQLSHVLGASNDDGVCANVQFPSYTKLLDETIAEADVDYATAVEQWDPDRVVWPLLAVIDQCAPTEPWCSVLASHLGLDGSGEKDRRLPVARKLAYLFDRYGRSRPTMITAWQAGHDEDGASGVLPDDLRWQAELWRRLRAELATPSPAELLDTACANLQPGPPFSIFGATRIAPARIRILQAMSAHRDVHLWLHHPSPGLWAKAAAARPGPRRTHHPIAKNPLLASMSRDVRELQQLLNESGHDDIHHPVPERPRTLLGRIQHDLAADEVPSQETPVDDTIQIHAAHGRARQVEIIREVILGLLEDDPTLEPRDILIMCPDVETFAPLIAASFGMADEPGGHPAAKLRVKLADRALRQTNPLLRLLAQLLETARSRVTATQLLDIAGAPPVRRLFGFDEDDLERMRDWTVAANARWGLDAQHRETYGLGGVAQNTWRAAIDRLLLGVAMEDDGSWVDQTLPLDDVDSADIDLAGRFAELVDRVDDAVRELNGKRTVREWTALLDLIARGLGEGSEAWQQIQLRRVLDDVGETATDRDIELGLNDITALLSDRLAGRPTRASFRTGTLTVCTLVPMRSVPHRVVCLIGMDDGAFPRKGVADGDDVLARDPRSGERDPRSEDRQLFLDAICAAKEHLVITYTGADPRTGADVPPCVPLGELMDAIDATAIGVDGRPAREQVVVRHPLQPFDPRNFRPHQLGRASSFSFDTSALAGARSAAHERTPIPPLVAEPLPDRDPRSDVVALDDLVRFLQHPVRAFLRERLDVATFTGEDEPAEEMTVELDGLQGWAIGERLLRMCLTGTPTATAAHLEYLRGELPPGALGQRQLTVIGRRIDALLAACETERQTAATSIEVNAPLGDGRTLAGTVGGVRGEAILDVTYSTLAPRHRLAAWVKYLAVVATTDGSDLRAVTVGRSKDDARRSVFHGVPAEFARQCLELLVAVYDAGMREPLPIALKTSEQYAARRQRGAAIADALPEACRRWEDDAFSPERDEPEHVLVFGRAAPFELLTSATPRPGEEFTDEPSRFGALARRVWGPLLMVEDVR